MYGASIVIEEGIDQRDSREIAYVEPREKDENLLKDMQNKLNELYKANRKIDTIKIIEAAGYTDHRKEVTNSYKKAIKIYKTL